VDIYIYISHSGLTSSCVTENRLQTQLPVYSIDFLSVLIVAFNIYLLGRQNMPSYELCCGGTRFATSAQCTNHRQSVLVAFAKLWKWLLALSCLFVRPSAWNISVPIGRILMKF